MAEPVSETSSAARIAARERFLSIDMREIIRRTYGFVKWERAQGLRGPSRGAPGADPRRRPGGFCPPRLPRRHGGPPRGGDRAVERRDLQLLPRQVVALLRARLPRPA